MVGKALQRNEVIAERYRLRLYDVMHVLCRQINNTGCMWHCVGFFQHFNAAKIRDSSLPNYGYSILHLKSLQMYGWDAIVCQSTL